MEFTRSVYMRDIYSIIKRLPQLQYLHFGHASTSVISQVPQCLPDLRVLQVHWLEGMFSKRLVKLQIGVYSYPIWPPLMRVSPIPNAKLLDNNIMSILAPKLSLLRYMPTLFGNPYLDEGKIDPQ